MSAAEKLAFLLALQDEHGGAIPFERWMQEALYHPRFGYYTANIRGIGRTGDFTTWPLAHESLARGIARWAEANKPKGAWHLIEVGAGTGQLAAAVRKALGWWNRPSYHIVEVSPVLKGLQQKALGKNAQWHDSVREALAACGGQALIFSNELVDAFPARIFQRQAAGWRELYLSIDGAKVRESWRETVLPASSVFTENWPEGQRVETQESFRRWQEEWRPGWTSGAMLTIDYGDLSSVVYVRRPRGTLRAYAHQQRLEGAEAYHGFGLRDLTVDVNFTDLQQWWPGSVFRTLAEFLAEQKETPPTSFRDAGEAFKVLEFRL